ncbi:DUF2149 domain-containing protein [Alloalcanivorax gelatiniphagus]|uniref:DUF2149 domain-containing protein n=1 Tax=Alloalcanivorax gelatiniphagus TaxID=1194167 RepID=A0ABY2XNI9_9GAMM|nr:DUF2149 domain-containing protein [Alloalcanivorax gelatiniphagus]TMW13334.1 DUF2149 domain-containing protein [Alloalcanivorax gelatiniphagus]|tara:strand:+ start:3314 stop:3673 length:360 start_codon:yes stop_codon:yes gene_type:complete
MHEHRLLRRHRRFTESALDDDPLSGIANLFDVSLAFIVALILALFSLFSLQDFLDPDSRVTVMTQNAAGETTLITKERESIKVQKVSDRELSGAGTRLGTAYRLADGQVVYVPEDGETP